MKWVKADVTQRRSHLNELLTQVRMPILNRDYLINFVRRDSLILSSHLTRDLYNQAVECYAIPELRIHLPSSYLTRPRGPEWKGKILV